MKLSKAQQEVIENAKERIDFARTHDFYDWYRNGLGSYRKDITNEEIDSNINNSKLGRDWHEMRYNWNKEGIDYLCHASSATIKKLEKLGLIEIVYDSNGEWYGFDRIKLVNY